MNFLRRKGLALLAAAVALMALFACNRPDRAGAPRLDPAERAPHRAAADARREVRDAGAAKSSAANAAPARAQASGANAQTTRAMGAAPAEKVDDASITARVSAALARDKDLHAMRVDVDTRDGVVTLSGLAPSASAKEQASELAHKVPGVRSVNNQLTIKSS